MRALVWQGEGGFAGEDVHRLAHRRLGPILALRGLSDGRVEHGEGPIRGAVERCVGPREGRPDVLVLPTFRRHLWGSLEAIAELAEAAPEVPVVLSGWGSRPDYLDAVSAPLDHPRLALALGEPEEALADALELLLGPRRSASFPRAELGALGLALPRKGGGWESRGRLRSVKDLAALPPVYGSGALSPAELSGLALVEVSRGCRNRCGFCLSGGFERPGVRSFPPAAVVAEVERAAALGAREVALLCSALNEDVEVLEALAAAFSERPALGGVRVESTIHASLLDPRRLAAIERLPWRRMIVGLQSITPEAARLMGRAADPARFKAAIERIAAFHAPVVELVLGLPGDTLEGFLRTLRFALELPARIEVYPLRLDPGSRFTRRRAELGLEADLSAKGMGRVTATPTFPGRDLAKAEAAIALLGARGRTFRALSLGFDFETVYES